MRFDQRATAEALAYLLGKELGLVEPVDTHRRDEATRTRAPLGPLVDALAPDRD
jgi:hypothetical protein